jgi:carbamoyl-phosphate synthase large subunit
MKKKLLVSGVGGSAFPYLFEVLEDKYELFCIDSDSKILNLYPDKNIIIVPKVNEISFNGCIKNIILENNIDFYIPLIDEEILIAHDICKDLKAEVISPSINFISLCLDKFALMQKLNNLDISSIPTYLASDYDNNLDYPLFFKPNIGRGSRGIKKIDNEDAFEAYFHLEEYTKDNVIIQPFVDGDEYTVSVTVNNLNRLISIMPKIVFTKKGITNHAKSIKNTIIENICRKIVELLEPCGSFNVQLKFYNNKVYIFEINPRFSTTLVLSIASGVNEVDLVIENFNKDKVEYINDFKELSLIRRWENIFYE